MYCTFVHETLLLGEKNQVYIFLVHDFFFVDYKKCCTIFCCYYLVIIPLAQLYIVTVLLLLASGYHLQYVRYYSYYILHVHTFYVQTVLYSLLYRSYLSTFLYIIPQQRALYIFAKSARGFVVFFFIIPKRCDDGSEDT